MDIKSFLSSKFSEPNYQLFLRDFLKDVKYLNFDANIPEQYKEYILNCKAECEFKDKNEARIVCLAIKVKEGSKAKTIQRNFVANLLSNGEFLNCQGAIAAFYDDFTFNWKLSFVVINYEISDKGNVELKFKPATRYSFIVGVGEPIKTCICQLSNIYNDKSLVPTLESISNAFSVNKISNDFYKDYTNKFYELYNFLIKEPDFITEAQRIGYKGDKDNEILDFAITFAKKTLGQIVFLYFLQKKGWLGVYPGDPWGNGDKHYLSNLIKDYHGDNFFKDVLEPLFYRALNKNRIDNLYNGLKVPFLNGGLFHPIKDYNWTETNFHIKNDFWFNDEESGFLDLLNQYNFTIDECNPDEQEIAVDPEMLGRIFESLLETKDRKDKGAFYTPREIVNYICTESLSRRISTDLGLDYDSIKNYILYDDALKETNTIERYADKIDQAISEYKICDPAVGSGAFLVGMLNNIVKLRMNLQKYLTLPNKKTKYDFKKECIQNCLYGVDIEFDAVEIAKLRLWLSLIVDEESDIRAPEPLPNLQFSLRLGNSLVSKYKGIRLWNSENIKKRKMSAKQLSLLENQDPIYYQTSLFENENIVSDYQEKLNEAIREFFSITDEELKVKMMIRIEQLQLSLIKVFVEKNGNTRLYDEICELIKKKSKPFFIWEIEFPIVFESENPGFDIVVGNPPYIQLQANKGKLSDEIIEQGFYSFDKMGDIYCLFYEQGYRLLKEKGVLAYITSNKWMRAGYGKRLRDFLARSTNPILLIDFSGTKVFDSATVDVNILEFEKSKNEGNTTCCTLNEKCTKNLSDYIMQNKSVCHFLDGNSWIISTDIETSIRTKIEKYGIALKKWDVKINYGIKTGFNNAFIIDENIKNQLISEDPKSAEIIRPILRGRDIKRYSYDFKLTFMICTFPSLKINIDEYPAIKKYLLSYGIERLEQSGKEYIVNGLKIKSRKKTNNKWYETQDSIAYWEDFTMQKIAWSETNDATNTKIAIIPENIFLDKTCFFLVSKNNLTHIYNVMSSTIFTWYMLQKSPRLGKKAISLTKETVEMFPVCIDDKNSDNIFNSYHLTKPEIDYLSKLK